MSDSFLFPLATFRILFHIVFMLQNDIIGAMSGELALFG